MYYTDIEQVAKKVGCIVIPDHTLGEICGQIEKKDDGSVVISYNPNHHENRRRFTIAHELAHYLLGHLDDENRLYRDTTKNYSLYNFDPKEVAANKTAAQLLMPKSVLNHLIFEKKITSIKELAKLMKVSELAMHYRLKNLGWISG